jgi:hypothetical protein
MDVRALHLSVHTQQLPGFEEFQKGLTAKQMQNYSTKGIIIVVNITDLRSDAIIITTDGFKAFFFSALCARQAIDWIDQDLSTTSQSDRDRKNKDVPSILVVAMA